MRASIGRGLLTTSLALALVLVPAAQAGTLDQQQTDTTNCGSSIGPPMPNALPVSVAQSFQAGITGNLDEIDVFLGFLEASPGALTVEIQNVTAAMGGDIPGGTVLGTEIVATPVAGWNQVMFSPSVAVTAGTKYAIALSASTLVGSWLGSGSMTDAYPNGNTSHQVGALGWAVNPSICDQAFKTYVAQPGAVTFASASAVRTTKGVAVRWRTGAEYETLGFRVYRIVNGKRVRASGSLIRATGAVAGSSYRFVDRRAPARRQLAYRIQAIDRAGSATWFGPVLRVRG